MFHLCSHGGRDPRDRAKPRLEGAHAVLRWLSRGHEIDAAMHLSQATRHRHACLHERPELPAFALGVAPHVSGLREPKRNRRVRTAGQSRGASRMTRENSPSDHLRKAKGFLRCTCRELQKVAAGGKRRPQLPSADGSLVGRLSERKFNSILVRAMTGRWRRLKSCS